VKKKAGFVLGLLVSAAGLWFALRGVDLRTVGAAWGTLTCPALLLLIPALSGVEYGLRTWRWRILLSAVAPSSIPALFPVTAGGFFLNNVLPFRAGEAARVYWTHRRTGAPVSSSVAILGADRLFDMASLATVATALLLRRADLFASPRPVFLMAGGVSAGIAGFLILAMYPEAAIRSLERFRAPGPLLRAVRSFSAGTGALRSVRTVLGLYILSLGIWTLIISLFIMAAGVFGMTLSFFDAAFLVTALCVGSALPSAPGYVGVMEAAGVAALGVLGYGKEISFPFIVTAHLMQILSSALYGVPAVLALGGVRDA
jgi:glycosyltransferase 2 family protein